ncbi:MAG TPA: hypothetical protein PLX84_09130 [Acidiphilium sp.]|nr:hypothetical protein [Acidiphilium sp.]
MLDRIDAAASAIGTSRSFTVSTLCRRGFENALGEGAADQAASAPSGPPLPGGALIIEINLDAPTPHVAIAETIQEAAELARERGLRWAAAGRPHELAGLVPPLEARAAICASIDLAGALATAPNWHRCPPQLIREGLAA